MVLGTLYFSAGPAVGEEGGGRGEWRTHGQRAGRPQTSAVCPRPGRCVCVCDRTVPLALSQPMLIPLLQHGGERGVLSHPKAHPSSALARAALRGWDPAGTALGTRFTKNNAPSARICDHFGAGRGSWIRLSPQHCFNDLRPCRGCSQSQPTSRALLDTVM